MGKTNPTYRDKVQRERDTYAQAERSLRRQFKPGWERLWVHATDHADMMHIRNPANTMEGILLSICLGQQCEILELQERLEELEEANE